MFGEEDDRLGVDERSSIRQFDSRTVSPNSPVESPKKALYSRNEELEIPESDSNSNSPPFGSRKQDLLAIDSKVKPHFPSTPSRFGQPALPSSPLSEKPFEGTPSVRPTSIRQSVIGGEFNERESRLERSTNYSRQEANKLYSQNYMIHLGNKLENTNRKLFSFNFALLLFYRTATAFFPKNASRRRI